MSECKLYPTKKNVSSPIDLPHGIPVSLGRGSQTKIKEKKCAAQQVTITADCTKQVATVTQLAQNSSSVNTKEIGRGKKANLHHGDVLELLSGRHKYELRFLPTNEASDVNVQVGQTDIPSSSRAKRAKVESEERKGAADKDSEDADEVSDAKKRKVEKAKSDLWEEVSDGQLLIFTKAGIKPSSKIAAYDMDFTLISTKSGKAFAKDKNDWQLLYPEIPEKLNELHKNGYKVVIISNQAGVAAGKVKVEDLKEKAEAVVKKLGVPIQAFFSTGKGIFRKPCSAVWEYMVEHKNGSIHQVDFKESFYCGDAAGREAGWMLGRKKDFSCSDRLFSLNLGIPFCTPEEHFLGQKPTPKFTLPKFCPTKLDMNPPLCNPKNANVTSNKPELVILVGMPGSGKSHFTRTIFEPLGYVSANRDTLSTWQKCVAMVTKALKEGKSAIVDNTNPDRESRKRYVEVAKKEGIPCRCFVMATDVEHAKHNNRFREFTDSKHSVVKDMIYGMFRNKYEEPSLDEGFKEIIQINFVPKFNNSQHEKFYKQYLMEK